MKKTEHTFDSVSLLAKTLGAEFFKISNGFCLKYSGKEIRVGSLRDAAIKIQELRHQGEFDL